MGHKPKASSEDKKRSDITKQGDVRSNGVPRSFKNLKPPNSPHKMKVVALLAFCLASVYCQTDSGVKVDPFIQLVRDIEASAFFPPMNLDDRLLTFEILAAAETLNLKALWDKLGYIVLLEYIDQLPKDYQHNFVKYSVEHLKNEYPDL